MKILVVVPYFEEPHRWMISGQKTARELARKNKVVVVTTGAKDSVEQATPNLTIYRIKDIFLKDPINYSVVPRLFSQTKKIIAKEKPEAVVINKHMFFTSLSVFVIRRLKLPVVVQVDTFPGLNWFPVNPLVKVVMVIYAHLIGNPILRAADQVILLHEGLIPVAEKLGVRYQVIHNGIDLTVFDATPIPTDLKKKKGDVWVGYVGRLESVKGWYDLAEAAKAVLKKRPNVHFFFIGPTKNAEEAIKKFSHPRIHFLGLRKDVYGIHKLLDVFVMPSLSEGLSNAIMEAMAGASACVVSNVGGNIVLITPEENGLVFEPGNINDLRQVLERIVDDGPLRQRLGQNARKTIVDKFDLQKTTEQLTSLLRHGQK